MKSAAVTGRVELTLLGEWRLTVGGRPATAPAYEKGRALLAYLAVESLWLTREQLGGLFWPDSFHSRANLRAVLADLRAVLQDNVAAVPCLLVQRNALCTSAEFVGMLDITEFLASPPRCREAPAVQECAACLGRMEQAACLYRGEFMAGFSLTDCPDFEEWLQCKRAALHRHAVALCDRLADCHERYGELARALTFARRATELDPWGEAAQRRLMRLLVVDGKKAAALRQFEMLESMLARDLGIQPEEATRDAYHSILVGGGGVPTAALPAKVNNGAGLHSPDEVRRVVVLQVEPDLEDETELLDPERRLFPLNEAFDAVLSYWRGQRFETTGLTLGAVFGLADDGEQAPRRAMRMALDIAALPEFDRTRIGVCEGKALIGREVGHSIANSTLPALAQRLALCGEPGNIVIAESLAGELGSSARLEPLPRRRFTGLAGEHSPCRLLTTSVEQGAPYPATFATPFVGRKDVRARLTAELETAARENRTAFVEVTGLAGTGKSRLLAEFAREHSATGGEIRWIAHCPELCHVSLGAVREAIRARITTVSRSAQADGVEEWLTRFFPERRDSLRAPLGALLGLEGCEAVDISGNCLLEAMIALLFSPSTRKKPVLLVFDDLHWADEAIRELLQIAIRVPPPAPILAVLTSRLPTGLAPPRGVVLPSITLGSLALAESLALISSIDQEGHIDAPRRVELAKMSGGLPLCAEYIARTARDQPVSDASLYGVLHGVLDRLDTDKQILQAASVFGATFRGVALRALLPEHDPEEALKRAEALAISRRTGKDSYTFHHALLRDCAYESIPPKLRRIWHHRAATWLLRQATAAPADIAQHFDEAHAWREARDFWWKAARDAYRDEFPRDARDAAMRALAAAKKDMEPITKEDKAELELLAGFALLMIEGYGSKKSRRFFEPIATCVRGELPDDTLIRALCGMVMAAPQGRREPLEYMGRADEMASTPVHRLLICYGFGSQLFWRGDFAESLRYLDEAIMIGEEPPASKWLPYCPDNPVVACRAFKGVNLAFSGSERAAQESAAQAVADARRDGRVHGLCFALTLGAGVQLILNRPEKMEQFAPEGLELATQWHFPFWQACNTLFNVWAKARQGQFRISESFKLVSMHREFAAASHMNPVMALWFVSSIFEAMESWSLLDASTGRALAFVEKGGDRFCAPDLMRQKTLARHARGDQEGARHWLGQAMALAETMDSRGLMPRLVQLGERIAISG